jgi:hypothetical protein
MMARTAWIALVVVTVGCQSKPNSIAVVAVHGQLKTADGQPAAGATISFHPLNAPSPRPFVPHGTVSATGDFTLTSYAPNDGAPPGEYAVTVTWRTQRADGDPAGPDRLKGRFADPAKPLARVTVGPDATTLPPFVLK